MFVTRIRKLLIHMYLKSKSVAGTGHTGQQQRFLAWVKIPQMARVILYVKGVV